METAVNETYGPDDFIELDGRRFVGCHFNGATLHYEASGPVELNGCLFMDCNWSFDGAASETIAFLRGLSQTRGGWELIDSILPR